jgi:hypothetical protein
MTRLTNHRGKQQQGALAAVPAAVVGLELLLPCVHLLHAQRRLLHSGLGPTAAS